MKCKYCHQSAGFFSRKHKECEQRHLSTLTEIKQHFFHKIGHTTLSTYTLLHEEYASKLSYGYIKEEDFQQIITETLELFFETLNTPIIPANLHAFIILLPTELKEQVTGLKSYSAYWTHLIKTQLENLNEGESIPELISALIKALRLVPAITTEIDKTVLSVLGQKIKEYLSDGIIDHEEEKKILRFIEDCSLTSSKELEKDSSYQLAVQSLVLRDIQEGIPVTRIDFGRLPILLGKKEQPLWIYSNVKAYEEKTGRRHIGGSRGVSMKICKGVYYRVGAYKGDSVEYQYQNPLGCGTLVVTNKNLFFIGEKSIKLGMSKIISYEPYSDGLVLVKDGANPKAYTFVGFEPWFVVNAMQLLVE